ncbi:hypothetical protein AL073_01250 [Loktanella sp. 1ANDIMAR09]|nr:hypothetical protein AL073_01250 [Loktanella sp. 1ANDIMAR09]
MARTLKTYAKNAVSVLGMTLISTQPSLAQSIVADGNGPLVIQAPNGTPMVMIATPGANGLSHNTYTEFGVGPGGAILNNADSNTILTDLAGQVQGNSNLSGGAASIILNEVTSTNPSVLNGFLEVAGQQADVIVANPNGITCDGCGFINTNRGTLTTGTPTVEAGALTGFSVDGGAIQIGTGGLDASDTTTFDLISRQIMVGGVVSGQRIRIVAGRNDVLYATGEVTEKASDGSTAPALAIDSTALGGMFANAITITSTEDGVGVRAPQNMAANAGGMMITADGRLVMNNATASQNIEVRSSDRVEVQGNLVAQEIDVTSADDLVLAANANLVAESAAILTTGGDLDIGAGAEIAATRFDFDIAHAFRVANGADVVSVETADIEAESLLNFGTLASTDGGLLVTTSLDLTNAGLMFGDTGVTLRSDESIFNNGGSIVANGDVTIRGDSNARALAFTNQFGGVVDTITGDISISAVSFGNLRDEIGPELADGVRTDGDANDAVCEGDTCYEELFAGDAISYENEASRIISAGNIVINADAATNAYSTISAFGNITIAGGSLTNIGQNYYRDNGVGSLEFIGADFGVIEAGGAINGTAIAGYVVNGATTALAAPEDLTGTTNTDLSTVDVASIGNPDLMVVNQDPEAAFLVETRPEFVDLDQFVSSDYFLDAIQYDPELKRFGDAYAEVQLIRKQLQELLGQLILTTGIDERAQIEAMYNNAINALENLDLTPGVALTPDQIGALTSDIIWLEETVIDGQRVLAPKVYLANPEIRFAGLSGAMITGQNVNFNTGNFDNSGSIRATDTISIAVRDTFRSSSGTISAENIAVIGNNIEIVTDARTVVTEQGITLVKLPLFPSASWTDREDRALQPATFAAGSTIVLTARDSITTAGAQITAGDNITLLAGGDITIGALALASERGRTSGSNRNRIERFDHLTTSLSAEGDITILSSGNVPGQNDIVLEGASVTAGGNVGLIAQDGDLVLAAVTDVYFRDYARKSGNIIRKKITRSQTLNVTNRTTSITGASITGVAARNILVEGSRFTIPGVPNSDLAPGQLSLVSVNGSTSFTAPTDIRARSSFRSTRYLGGLITNSRDKRSLVTDSVGAVANTAGDIGINSGADLTLTAVDFNAGGEFVTQVTGTTYLLAAINVEYDFLVEHKDNGVIMTDIRSEDLTENVTFNAIEAAGGVNFDITSQIVLAGVRNPLIDSMQTGGWVAESADSGRMNIADVYLDKSDDAAATDEDATDEDPHWREAGEWSEEGEFLVRQVALPTGADGAEYAYLAGVLSRESTINEPIELVSYSFYEKEQALSPAFKALLTIVVTQGVSLSGVLNIAGNLHGVAGVSLTTVTTAGTQLTALGTAVNAMAASTIVGVIDGAVAGDIDMGEILGQASFSALSAGLTAKINLATFDGDWEGMAWAEESIGFGENLTFANLVEHGIDATITAGLSSAVYETDFLDSFESSLKASAVNMVMVDLQTGVGDGVERGLYSEGSVPHALLHGAVGCAAAEGLGGNCASGAAAGIAQSIYAGILNRTAPDGSDPAVYNAWRAQVGDTAQLIGASVGYFTSGGDASNVSNGGSIAQSGVLNNYLYHHESERLAASKAALLDCSEDVNACDQTTLQNLESEIARLETLDTLRDNLLLSLCGGGHVQLCIAARADLEQAALSYTLAANQFDTKEEYFASVGGDEIAQAIMQEFTELRPLHVESERIAMNASSLPFDVRAYGVGLAGGVIIGASIAATPSLISCVGNPVCWGELGLAVSEISGATAGQVAVTATVGGKLLLQNGDAIVGVVDDALGVVLRPTGDFVAGRLIVELPSGGIGYYDDGGRLLDGFPVASGIVPTVDDVARLNVVDTASGKLAPGEANAAAVLEQHFGVQMRRANNAEVDFVIVSGPNRGQTVDFIYAIDGSNAYTVENFNRNFADNFAEGADILFRGHFDKANIVPVDLRNLTAPNRALVLDYIDTLTTSQQSKVVILE